MNGRRFVVSLACLCVLALGAAFATQQLPETAAIGAPTGNRILRSAENFLAALSEGDRKRAIFEFSDDERFNWHFIPRSRKGVVLLALDEDTQALARALLRASLSELGFRKAEDVRFLEGVLRELEGETRRFARDPLLYHVSIFGQPSATSRWGWRFEGHHFSANFTLDGSRLISSTPIVYGANPALVRHGPRKGLRLLAAEEDAARELVKSLTDAQRKACLGDDAPQEVPDTTKPVYGSALPSGVAASDLNDGAKATLRSLLRTYRDYLVEDAGVGLDPGDLDGVHFAWRGGLEMGEGHSYIVHSPRWVINYSNVQNNAYHIHASLREIKTDFGQPAP